MPSAAREILQNGRSYDETDRMPDNITISNFDLFLYVFAIVGHFVDLGVDINVAVRYWMSGQAMEFGWTLAFILLPAFVNTAVSVRMYSQDKQQESVSNEVSRLKWLRVVMLVMLLAPVLRLVDALIYALKSRRAAKKRDPSSQRLYYALMLKEDSDAALLRIFECFLEAAPQQVLQTSLLFRGNESLTVHQLLSISSSTVGMGWCLAAYQRAVRFAQQDKLNMTWAGTSLQTACHFLVSLSRIISLSAVAYIYPHWTLLGCSIHILAMTMWLQFFDRSPFCSHNKLAEIAFSLALGAVYLFTYILPIEGRTRYRYTVYYTICFLQNIACFLIWFFYSTMSSLIYFYSVLVLSIVPYVLGLVFLVVYYGFFHPKLKAVSDVADLTFSFKAGEQTIETVS